jgi:hypothetical protein
VLKIVLRVGVRVLIALVVVLLLWSVRFRFDHIIVDNETYLVRVHRVTGDADILIPGEGWVPAEDAWSDSSEVPPTSASANRPRRHAMALEFAGSGADDLDRSSKCVSVSRSSLQP